MKKALAIFMVLAMVTGVAFAQDAPAAAAITIGGWGRGVFLPVINSGAEDEDSTSTNAASWGAAPRVGITIAGNSENVGFQIDMNGDGGTINAGDQQKIWIKPVSMVTVQMGAIYDDTLRGNGTFGSFNWFRPYGGGGDAESLTFSRLGEARGAQNFEVSVAPIPGLFAAVYLANVGQGGTTNLTENLAKNAQIAAGYTIDGAGQIRAQIVQKYDATADETAQRFEVAFKLTAIENLYADVGFKMELNDAANIQSDVAADQTPKTIALYANYKVAAATIHGLAKIDMFADNDTMMQFGVGADYGLADGLGLSGDVRYWNDAASGAVDEDGEVIAKTTAFVGLTKGFSNGVIGVGVQIISAANMGYAIPIRMEYWF